MTKRNFFLWTAIADVMLVLAGNIFFSSLALKFFVDFRHPVSEFGAKDRTQESTEINKINSKMDFSKKSKVKLMKSPDEDAFEQLLRHNCMFYILPPMIDVSLSEFETLGEFLTNLYLLVKFKTYQISRVFVFQLSSV